MDLGNLSIPGPSHGRPHVSRVSLTGNDFEGQLQDLVFDVLEGPSEPDPYNSDKDDDYQIESDHDSESEQECEENDDVFVPMENRSTEDEDSDEPPAKSSRQSHFLGKKIGKREIFKWKKQSPPTNIRTRRHNIIVQLPGLKAKAKQLGTNPSIEEVWSLLITNDILEEIMKWTNHKISSLRENYTKKYSYLCDLDMIELKAFIGLLVFTAIFKSQHETVDSLFATDGTGRDIFRCTIPKNRFLFILLALRFDNPNDRDERKKTDPSAAVSEIFNKFIENSRELYSPGPTMCVDEMLVPFRGRCTFKMYMPKKPAKYGLKVMCLTDARTHYVYNWYMYCGKGSDGRGLSNEEKKLLIPSQAVIKLVKPIDGSRRNITADNWFSSVELVNELLKRDLTYVGTLKKNKAEIPPEFQPNKTRVEKSSLYGFTEDLTLLSYVPKKGKAVILISSMHHSSADDNDSGKPEIIGFYNLTKGGVDAVDQKCANYSASRRTRRWPVKIFFTILDVACGVNSFVLYQSYEDTEKLSRFEFMKTLANNLIHPHMARRTESTKNLPRELQLCINRILKKEDDVQDIPEFFETRKTCSTCPPRLKRRTKYPCRKCGSAICLECANKICKDCFLNQ